MFPAQQRMASFLGLLLLLLVTAACGRTTAPEGNPCGPKEWYNSGKCYKFEFKEPLARDDARKKCQEYGGHLVAISSQEEHDILSKRLVNKFRRGHWQTGGRKAGDTWQWEDAGEPFGLFTNWYPRMSRNPKAVRQCVILQNAFPLSKRGNVARTRDFYWTLVRCDRLLPYICERDPEENDSTVELEIRLVNPNRVQSKSPSVGRVEVGAKGEWGVVCDTAWSIRDATVACRQLGFPLGAAEAFVGSTFGEGNGNFVLANVNCRGTETSLSRCQLPGWKEMTCLSGKTAGVQCRLSAEECPDNQFRCQNSECIFITKLCDGRKDCSDSSDEDPANCKSPLSIRLAGSSNNASGRVEVRRYGVWGTVCSEDFDDNEAAVICRMLGFSGPATAHRNGFFGLGKGQIWMSQLQCRGHEADIAQCPYSPFSFLSCRHLEDAGVTCSADPPTFSLIGRSAVKCGVRDIEDDTDDRTNSITSPNRGGQRRKKWPAAKRRGREKSQVSVFRLPSKDAVEVFNISRKAKKRSGRMVGGRDARYGSIPWQAQLRHHLRGVSVHKCGGVVISEFYILTAAHCFENNVSEYIVRVGEGNQDVIEEFQQDFEVDRVRIHPSYYAKQGFPENDVAVVKVKTKAGRGVLFNSHVKPVCLPNPQTEYTAGRKCSVSGWGKTTTANESVSIQTAEVPILSMEDCRKRNVYGPSRIKEGMFCAGYLEGGVDACKKDSGGPLVCKDRGRYVLFGIVSWGFGCAKANKPGVYTKVKSHLDWIYTQMDIMAG